jgi:tRNA-2-methylthio-N6-dimethylallyladenosine synthase
MVGSVETVLVEGLSRRRTSDLAGKTEGHTTVNFPGPLEWRGRLIPVRITEATPNAVRGEAVVG